MARYCFTSQVDPRHLDRYRERHAAVWPEMLAALRDAGWRHYSLFLSETGLLVGYFEADDRTLAQARMSATQVNARWQAEMALLFAAGPGPTDTTDTTDAGSARAPGRPDEEFRYLPEVFNLDDQLRAAGLPTG